MTDCPFCGADVTDSDGKYRLADHLKSGDCPPAEENKERAPSGEADRLDAGPSSAGRGRPSSSPTAVFRTEVTEQDI